MGNKRAKNLSESIHIRIRQEHYDFFIRESLRMHISIPQTIRFFLDENISDQKEFKVGYIKRKAKGPSNNKRNGSGATASL